MDKKNAIWFSRHQPTQAQLDECAARGWNVVALDQGMELGARNILDDGDVYAIGQALLGLAADHGACWRLDGSVRTIAGGAGACNRRMDRRGMLCRGTQPSADGGKPVLSIGGSVRSVARRAARWWSKV